MKSSVCNENEDIVCVGVLSEYNKELTKLENEGIDLDGDGNVDEISNGDDDGLIASYDKNGKLLWSETFGGIYDDSCEKIIKTKDNCYIIVGKISSPVVYLNGKIINELSTKNYETKGQDGFILKINQNGKYSWAARIGGNMDDEITSIIETQNGEFVLGGNFKSKELNLYEYGSNYTLKKKIQNEGEQNSFLTSYTKEGKYMWSKKISGNDFMEITNIVENDNEIAIVLNYKGSLETQNIKCESYNTEGKNSIILKMNTDGNIKWGYDMYSIPKNEYMQDNHINITGITMTKEENVIAAINCSGKIFSKNLISEQEYQNIYTNEKNGICTNIIELTKDGEFNKNIYDLSGKTTFDARATSVNITDIKATNDNKLIIGGYYYSGKMIDVNKDGNLDKSTDFASSSGYSPNGFFEKITLEGEVEFADCMYQGDNELYSASCITNANELNSDKIIAVGWFEWTNLTTRNFYSKYLEENPYIKVDTKKMNGLILNENYRREDLEEIISKEITVKNYKKTSTKEDDQINKIEEIPLTGGGNILIIKIMSIILVCIGLYLINYATYKKGEK